ncbi:MAG: amidohydrolase family protein [Saprospiraceae bacterium]|nr:amidohydrolase [Bacteroidia bacterium]NNE15636.1 amidohydrolase family protein [Saprospiraceae bacterium]NNL90641.1 amidohydrolase family protein [Saprospiraceae bacterium]
MRINAHSHLLPYPDQIPSFMREKEIFWVDDSKQFMLQKNWKRPVTDPSFFLNEKMDWMSRNNIDHAVILNLSQLYGNGLRYEEMKQVLRFQNDFNGKVQNDHPDKFTCGFVIHAGFIKSALWEIERCVEELGLRVLCLPTHYMDSIGTWRTIFDAETEPIFELANKYKLAVEIHPYDGEKFINLENTAWRFHLVWMLAQCADAYHFFTLNAYQEKYPDMRVCFAHGGQLAQINLGRRIQGFDGRPDLFEGKTHPRKAIGHPNIFFDTLVHDTDSLELMVRRNGTNQIVMGLDDPYPLGEMESQPQSSYPGKILDLALERKIIDQNQYDDIWENNVLRWLGEEQAGKIKSNKSN